MTRSHIVAASLFTAVAVSMSVFAADETIAVGVACSDGTFLPLAARSEGAWTPLEESNSSDFVSVLTSEARRLPRRGWTFYPRASGKPRPLVLGSPRGKEKVELAPCWQVQVFNSDGPRTDRRASPGTIDGTVLGGGVLGPARFERDDVTAQPDESSRLVAARVVREVNTVEREVVRRLGSESPLDQFAGKKEVRSIVRLVTMIRHRSPDGDWYFFQAAKEYREPSVVAGTREVKVWARLLVNGWARSSSGGLSTFDLTGAFEEDNGKCCPNYIVEGVAVIDDRAVWIIHVGAYEASYYELFEVGPGDMTPRSVAAVATSGS